MFGNHLDRLRRSAPPLRPTLANAAGANAVGAAALEANAIDTRTVEIRDVTVRLGGRIVLDRIDGRFAPGSLTAVAGPNGAGKTTLLNVLAGTNRPTRGAVVCPARARGRLAYLTQDTELDRSFPVTVDELVGLGLWRRHGAFRAVRQPSLVDDALDAVGLRASRDRQIGDLSGGQMRRALFARLFLLDADVILLDEPFAAIDAATVEALLAMIAGWHRKGRTVIAVVHDLEQVRAHFPSTLLLARTPIAWGETHAVLTAEHLAKARPAG